MADKENKNNNNFTLIEQYQKLSKYSRVNILISIPKIHNDIKIHYQDELYYLGRNIYYASFTIGNIRMKYLTDILVNLSMIDLLLTDIKDIKCTDNKKIYNTISFLSNIKNIIYGWKFNEEKKK